MNKQRKLLKDDPKSEQAKMTSQFLKRINEVKLQPEIKGHGDLVSGPFEKEQWTFVCSEHVSGRFTNEEELKKHFREKPHGNSKRGRSKSMYD